MKQNKLKSLLLGNYFLLSLVLILIFVVQLFPGEMQDLLFDIFFTLIYITATLTVERFKKQFVGFALVLMILSWISTPENFPVLNIISKAIAILFFCLVVFSFIMMISRSKQVNTKVILESINGYLLMGIMFALLMALVMFFNPDSFRFPDAAARNPEAAKYFSNYIYFTLVSMTTLGYGDIVPVSPAAKSLATFISVSGQLYIAIIIALLVGKFASQKH